MLDRIRQDLAFAMRGLLSGRGVNAVAIVSLAIGIAANTTVFSLVQAVEFPQLIYPDASRLVFVESRSHTRGLIGMLVSVPDAVDIAAASRTLEHASLAGLQRSVLRVGSTGRRVSGRRVEPSFFEAMHVPAASGRVLRPDDEPGVIVLSDSLWRTHLGSDPSLVGRPIGFDGGVVTVVGIMPPRFDPDADFWTPLTSSLGTFARDDRQFSLFARLRPEASLEDASRELAAISGRLAGEHPGTNRDWVMFPTPITRMHGRDSRQSFLLLQAAVGFVLLIACANIANILLARGTRRRHEMAVRVSLGASRGRLLSGLLVEAIVLSLAGGALGVLLSMWGIRLTRIIGGFPDVIDPRLNLIVLAFTAALSMVTGILCGILPAVRASGVAPDTVLREAGRGASGDSKGRLRACLAAAQIAAALVLATCAVLMAQTVANRQRVDLGFEPKGAIRAEVGLPPDRYRDPDAVRNRVHGILDQLARQPGVVAAGASTWALPTGAGAQRQLTLPARQDFALSGTIRRGTEAVTPRYFEAQGLTLKAGRAFAEGDREGTSPVAIVDEQLVRHLWADQDPVGELLRLGAPGEGAPVVSVVGVVGSVRRSWMHDTPVARVYVPFAQHPNGTVTIVVRAHHDVGTAGRTIETVVRSADSSLLVEGVRSLEADVARFAAPIRLTSVLFAAFGLTGVLLAALGVFGTMSYTVSQRQRDLAVRAALGADRGSILRLVLGSVLRITAAGMVAGLGLAFVAARALDSLLFGVSPTDPFTYATVAAFLVLVSLAACYRPARLAAAADPVSVLRQ
jgi:predicted permease